MKLSIHDDENGKIYPIKISEFNMLNDIFEDLVNKKILTLSDFDGKVLVYKNVIISGKRIYGTNYGKIIKFYNISNNDEIWFGKIGNYLTKNDVILEVCTSELGGDFMYLIMKKTDKISKIKLTVEKFIGKIVNIWIMNGNKINDEDTIDSIDFDSKYCRIIIGCESNFNTFINSCKLCEDYLLDYLLREIFKLRFWQQLLTNEWKYKGRNFIEWNFKQGELVLNERDSFLLWFYKYFDSEKYEEKLEEIAIDQCRMRTIEAKKEILSNTKYDYKLPAVFINTRLLFCVHMIDLIGEMFDHYKKSVAHLLKISLQLAVIMYTNENRYQFSCDDDKSMKTILIDIFDFIENVFIHSIENVRFWVKLFFDQFLFRVYTDSDITGFIYGFLHPGIESFLIKINGERHYLYTRKPKTLFDMKKAISLKTGLPIKCFQFMDSLVDEKPKDEYEYNGFFSDIEFVSSIGEIKILKSLGRGAFGEIILCQNKSSGKEFVLKKPLGENIDLFREISIQHRFKFSNILFSYLKLFDSDGTICLAMKLLSGGSLSSHLKKHKIPEEQIAKWCYQILIQINELHKSGIMHRDIKADNIGLDEDNNAYLIDFGLSICSGRYSSEEMLERLKKYKPGTSVFMAPEIINSEIYTKKIDIWSFGTTVIEMVTGKRPYPLLTIVQAIVRLSTTRKIEYEPLEQLSNELENFIESCLNPDQNERPSACDLINSKFILKHRNNFIK